MKINIQIIAGICVLIAIGAWVAIWYIGNDILDQASARASVASNAQVQSDRAAYTQRIAALVSDTKEDRAALENAANMNIVSIVSLIESVGAKSGIVVKVNNAQAQGGATVLPGGALSEFAITVEADGSISQVMKAAAALESLPVPSSIGQLEILHNGGEPGKDHGWHLNARIKVFTTSTS